jgi:N-acetylneuraminic acid mutarotase
MKILALAFAAVLATVGVFASAQDELAGSWAAESSGFSFARGGAATDGTYLYLFGGYQAGVTASYPSYYRAARRYDPANNSWTTLQALPNAPSGVTYQYNAGAYYGGQLYSFGTSYARAAGIVLSYSIAGNQWTVLSDVAFPDGRYGAAAAVLGDRIYIAGGYAGGPSRRTDEFNPGDNSFTRRADLPVGLHLPAMAPMPWRGSAYVLGGYAGGAAQAACYEYAPASDTWTSRAPLQIDGTPQPRGYPGAFVLNNRMYVAGGTTGSSPSSSVFEYLPAWDVWTTRAPMAAARYQHAAVAINGRGYVYGGNPSTTTGEEFTPPDFGPPPQAPENVAQTGSQGETSLQAQAEVARLDGWTSDRIEFSAEVSDPDPGQRVRLRIRVKPVGIPDWKELDSGLVAQGAIRVAYDIPNEGAYDWEFRVEDANANSWPADPDGWAPAFGNSNSPDFRSDRTPPSNPVGRSPDDADVGVPDPAGGMVTLAWNEAGDNGPASGISYEIEVGADSGFRRPLVRSVAVGTDSISIHLPVARNPWTWRVRARDVAGNLSGWSRPLEFRVVYDDRLNHAAGDGRRICGFGGGPAAGPAGLIALALALAGSIVHSRIRANSAKPI